MNVTVYDTGTAYRFCVALSDTEGDLFEREWGKESPEGQTLDEYLINCRNEFILLAELELQQRQPPQEIVLPPM